MYLYSCIHVFISHLIINAFLSSFSCSALALTATAGSMAYLHTTATENDCIVSETQLIKDFKATGPIYSSYAGYDSKSHPVQHQ
jgi:hypothetical protein